MATFWVTYGNQLGYFIFQHLVTLTAMTISLKKSSLSLSLSLFGCFEDDDDNNNNDDDNNDDDNNDDDNNNDSDDDTC